MYGFGRIGGESVAFILIFGLSLRLHFPYIRSIRRETDVRKVR